MLELLHANINKRIQNLIEIDAPKRGKFASIDKINELKIYLSKQQKATVKMSITTFRVPSTSIVIDLLSIQQFVDPSTGYMINVKYITYHVQKK